MPGIMGIGMAGIPGMPDPADDCGPTPGGSAGIFGTDGRGGIAGMAGEICVCGLMPGGSAGIFGMAGIGGATSADCGPMPGGKPPVGIGISGTPGVGAVAAFVAGFKYTKLRLFGKSNVSSPELRS